MNAPPSPHDFSAQPHRARDVITIISRPHRAIEKALIPYTRRPSRQVRERIQDVLEEIRFFPMYLNGMSMSGLDGALDDAGNAIAALDAAVTHDRGTIAGRFAQWRHFRRHPKEYHIIAEAPTALGKGVGRVIPKLLDWNGPIEIHDPKRDPDAPK